MCELEDEVICKENSETESGSDSDSNIGSEDYITLTVNVRRRALHGLGRYMSSDKKSKSQKANPRTKKRRGPIASLKKTQTKIGKMTSFD